MPIIEQTYANDWQSEMFELAVQNEEKKRKGKIDRSRIVEWLMINVFWDFVKKYLLYILLVSEW